VIEQALYTSARTDLAAGYQIVAHSPGLGDAALRELAAWGPSHDSLWDGTADASSVNFFPLGGGAYCISKTVPMCADYSGRSGHRLQTQCLVVSAEILARFANNPFAILTAAAAQGALREFEEIPTSLEPFRLGGRAAVLDQGLFAQIQRDPGGVWLGRAVDQILSQANLVLVTGSHRHKLMTAIFASFPVALRPEITFTTGLKHSPCRPFRVLCGNGDDVDQRRVWRRHGLAIMDVSARQAAPPLAQGWGAFVAAALATGNASHLGEELARPRPGLRLADLADLGGNLTDQLPPGSTSGAPPPVARAPDVTRPVPPRPPRAAAEEDARRADAPHARFQRTVDAAALLQALPELSDDPSLVLGWQCPQAMERLGILDDTLFEAIAGKPGAFEQLRLLWPAVLKELGPRLLEESRENYLRHALKVWRDCVEGDQIANAALAIAAMDVVCLLVGEA